MVPFVGSLLSSTTSLDSTNQASIAPPKAPGEANSSRPDRITRSDPSGNLPSYRDAIAKLSTAAASDSTLTPGAELDPWGLAAGTVGGALGAAFGGGTGGIGAGAAGTLVAPGVGTVAGAAVGGAEGAAIGAATGAAIGYGVGSAAHEMVTRMTGSSSTSGSGGIGDAQKPDPIASNPYRSDPAQFEGRLETEVEKELDEKLVNDGHWMKGPNKDGNGVRYIDGKGQLISVSKGYPKGITGGDLVHRGPYVKLMPDDIRIPLAGNPAVIGK